MLFSNCQCETVRSAILATAWLLVFILFISSYCARIAAFCSQLYKQNAHDNLSCIQAAKDDGKTAETKSALPTSYCSQMENFTFDVSQLARQ